MSIEGSRDMGQEGEPQPSFLTPEQVARFEQLSAEVYERREGLMVDVNFGELSPEQQKQIVALEEEYNDSQLSIRESSAKKKLEWLGRAVKRVAEFLDLDTKEKIMAAALEVVPYVGLAYAVCGKRVEFFKDEVTGKRSVSFEDIDLIDRILYLAGEVLVSGHALRGAFHSVKREGLKKILGLAVKEVGKNATTLLVKRAKEGAARDFGLLPGKGETGGQEEEK
ncbi:MAG: hypothetical protein ABIJ46_00190 [bacterium]